MSATASAALWRVSVKPRPGYTPPELSGLRGELAALGPSLARRFGSAGAALTESADRVGFEYGFLVETSASAEQLSRAGRGLLFDAVLESASVEGLSSDAAGPTDVTVLRKPGVMDPVAQSAAEALQAAGVPIDGLRGWRRWRFPEGTPKELLDELADKVLANDAIEQAVTGPIASGHLTPGGDYRFQRIEVPMLGADDAELTRISKEGGLYLNLIEMRSIRDHFAGLGRQPTDVELETLAQTWSEHCSHKTLRGPYEFNGQRGSKGLLKETIMAATEQLRSDWLVSVFKDNAGVVRFDDDFHICFKVETHNHPSAIEPYGGANTGIGGVIRDPLGTCLGAKPIANTDVFCFARPDTPHDALPDGVLHPARVMRGVVAGVRDYGNRMGIPTVNGAVCFDERYLGNPLVYCGTVGIIPVNRTEKEVRAGDLIVAVGGRTGRDGIHGATFSSGELTRESESVSGGAVQIGNAITEKKVLDVILQARDRGLYRGITDCGAGGFSSAVGEMGAELGAIVDLDKAPLKYRGLSYTEVWISESQERMVLAVPPEHWLELEELAASEDVEASVLGVFQSTGRLELRWHGETVGDLSMEFLHDGRPPITRFGEWPVDRVTQWSGPALPSGSLGETLKAILASPNVASKEWIIRQYDHEVQGGSVIKPLVGVEEDGPGDAAVVRPRLDSFRGAAIGCGINPRYGDLDPYRMAASAIDEAVRNVVSVGGDPSKTALLDNFCWGNTERPEVFGSLAQAAFACRDIAIGLGTPFISGKDSLYNEFVSDGTRIVIPPTLLISALAIVPDVRRSMTMDLKEPGNVLVLVGQTRAELGGSHLALVLGATGGEVPTVDTLVARDTFRAVHGAIAGGLVRACHDLSEGGLAVAAAEMAFAGGLGAELDLACAPADGITDDATLMFSESNTRFLLEVEPSSLDAVRERLGNVPHGVVGRVTAGNRLVVHSLGGEPVVEEALADLKNVWRKTLAMS